MDTLWQVLDQMISPIVFFLHILYAFLGIVYVFIGLSLGYICYSTWSDGAMEPLSHPFRRWLFFPRKSYYGTFGQLDAWYGYYKPGLYYFMAICILFWPIKIIVDLTLAAILYPLHRHKNR